MQVKEPLRARDRRFLGAAKRLLLLHRSLRLKHVEFSLQGEHGLDPLRVAYIGEGLSLPYYLHLFGVADRGVTASHRSAFTLPRAVAAARRRLPLVLVEINAWLGFLLPRGGWTTVPWVRQVTDLEGERFRHRRRGIERNFGWATRRYGFQCTVSHEREDLETFYHEYYVPHVRQRHGEFAAIRSFAQLKRAIGRGFLVQVRQGGSWVSGLVVSLADSKRVHLVAAGLHPSRLPGWQDGALSAADYFVLCWAKENGLRTVDFGGSRPHLSDGVFRHKVLWAAEPAFDSWHHTRIAFYLAPGVRFPVSVVHQLVRKDDRLIPIAECLET